MNAAVGEADLRPVPDTKENVIYISNPGARPNEKR